MSSIVDGHGAEFVLHDAKALAVLPVQHVVEQRRFSRAEEARDDGAGALHKASGERAAALRGEDLRIGEAVRIVLWRRVLAEDAHRALCARAVASANATRCGGGGDEAEGGGRVSPGMVCRRGDSDSEEHVRAPQMSHQRTGVSTHARRWGRASETEQLQTPQMSWLRAPQLKFACAASCRTNSSS